MVKSELAIDSGLGWAKESELGFGSLAVKTQNSKTNELWDSRGNY